MNLYEINNEEMVVWSDSVTSAIEIVGEFGVCVKNVRHVHANEIVVITKEDTNTGELEWELDYNDMKKPVRRTTVGKLAIELGYNKK